MDHSPSSGNLNTSTTPTTTTTTTKPKTLQQKQQPWHLLQPGGLYILLYIRNQPNQPDDFHWALYLHTSSPTTTTLEGSSNPPSTSSIRHHPAIGHKFHISNLLTGTWLPDHGPCTSVFTQFLLCGIFHVGVVPDIEKNFDRVVSSSEGIKKFDGVLNDDERDSDNEGEEKKKKKKKKVTCRTWLWDVLKVLGGMEVEVDEEEKGTKEEKKKRTVVQCEDWEGLEREVMDFGNTYAEDACRAVMPRPVGRSEICKGL